MNDQRFDMICGECKYWRSGRSRECDERLFDDEVPDQEFKPDYCNFISVSKKTIYNRRIELAITIPTNIETFDD